MPLIPSFALFLGRCPGRRPATSEVLHVSQPGALELRAARDSGDAGFKRASRCPGRLSSSFITSASWIWIAGLPEGPTADS
jgi:hypothetical protein